MKLAWLVPLVACLLIASLSAAAQEADLQWPQWRGPRRDGQLAGKPWPATLDRDTFAKQWRLDFVKEYQTSVPDFGGVSSPMLLGDHVFVQAGSGLVKVEKHTGKPVWRGLEKGPGKSGNGAFASPYAAKIGGAERIFVQTREELVCVDPDKGDVLWKTRIPALFGMNIFTPTIYKDAVLTSTMAGTFLVTAAQVVTPATDPDAGAGAAKAPGEMLWKNVLQGYMSSPILIGDHAYIHLRNQRVACVNLADGKRTWTSKPMSVYLSMVAQGDKILALGDDGVLRLFAANPEAETRLGEVSLLPPGSGDSSWAHLAVAGEQFFVRDLTGVTAYRWTDAADRGRSD